jgi:hypothetical protein
MWVLAWAYILSKYILANVYAKSPSNISPNPIRSQMQSCRILSKFILKEWLLWPPSSRKVSNIVGCSKPLYFRYVLAPTKDTFDVQISLLSMKSWAEGQACAAPGARTTIFTSGFLARVVAFEKNSAILWLFFETCILVDSIERW